MTESRTTDARRGPAIHAVPAAYEVVLLDPSAPTGDCVESFAGAWPEREVAGEEDAGMAKRLGDMRKIVASRSPLEVTWRNSEQLDGDLVETVTALKNDPSIRRIALSGSVSVVRQLLDAGLLDELHLFVHPAAAGSGLKLFEEGGPSRHLKLISAQPFDTGVVYLVHGPEPNPPAGIYGEAKASLPQG